MTIQRMDHVGVVVDDLDATVAGLRAHGAELVGEVARYQDSYRLCYVRGPEGDHRRIGRAAQLTPVAADLRPTGTIRWADQQ